ncbi:NAD-aldehyde dehydrogenase [Cyathus striatus]|nr:NAD-aldehyde dehydrogenase [Cyathus striatus]
MSGLQYTPLEEIGKIHATLRAGFRTGKLKSIEYRKYQLLQLGYLIKDNADRFSEALRLDLGRPALETQMCEINPSITDVKHALDNVDKWAKPEKPAFTINYSAMRPVIYKEAKGVILIITPFNYPLWLSIGPLVGAIASGNAAVLKPSESTPNVSALYAELFPKYLDPELYAVVNGAVAETTKALELPWDHIMYTGSGRVGKIIATAAAKHLTPVTLELGGKSPVIIDPKCDLETAAKRILWGKCVNAGQTCVAPDYILVPKDFQDTFVKALQDAHSSFYPTESGPSVPYQYCRLITPQAFKRVKTLLDITKGTVAIGGETDEATKYIAPTIVKDVKGDDSLMTEEIFGPVLPIVPVENVDEAIKFVNERDHPLALYVFSQDSAFKDKITKNTQSGAIIMNETVIHPAAEGLPFGGVGPSGYGQQTGKYSFDTFTHLRASMDSPSWIDMILKFRYPPYSDKNVKASLRLLPSLPRRPSGPPLLAAVSKGWGKWFFVALAAAVAGILTRREKILRS